MKNINDVIKYPILTEKTYQQMPENVYTFAVDRRASKIEIKEAVEFIFNVKVDKVNTFNVPKKEKRVGKYTGYLNSYKKAIIKLKEGSINFFPEEGIAKDDKLKEENSEEKIKKAKEVEALENKIAQKIQAKDKQNNKIKNSSDVKEDENK